MGNTDLERTIRERQEQLGRDLGGQVRTARLDAGLSIRGLGRATGLDASHILRVERGKRDASIDAAVALAAALGHDVSVRLFPSSGPRLRDHVQVRMLEALLAILHPRWQARLEVPVYRPSRGVIDVVLSDAKASQLVAGEGHSQLRAFEEQLRRAREKADALPSARGYPWADVLEPPRVSRLLLLRSTTATRDLVRTLSASFRAAYPAGSRDAYAALTTAATPWPGAAILWVDLDGKATTVLHGPPRGVTT
jgi:transcriptional regulator with XRE-family HTH domain